MTLNLLAHTEAIWDAGFAEMGWFAIKAILVWAGLAVMWVPIVICIAMFAEWCKR